MAPESSKLSFLICSNFASDRIYLMGILSSSVSIERLVRRGTWEETSWRRAPATHVSSTSSSCINVILRSWSEKESSRVKPAGEHTGTVISMRRRLGRSGRPVRASTMIIQSETCSFFSDVHFNSRTRRAYH